MRATTETEADTRANRVEPTAFDGLTQSRPQRATAGWVQA